MILKPEYQLPSVETIAVVSIGLSYPIPDIFSAPLLPHET
jgi:hypothetical protein